MKLLRIKAWQLFVIIYAVPTIACAVLGVLSGDSAEMTYISSFFLPGLFYITGMSIWTWQLNSLSAQRRSAGQLYITLVRILIGLHLFAYFLLSVYGFHSINDTLMQYESHSRTQEKIFMVQLGLFVLLCIAIARLLIVIIHGKFLGFFAALIFFPIGLWVIQPQINRQVND